MSNKEYNLRCFAAMLRVAESATLEDYTQALRYVAAHGCLTKHVPASAGKRAHCGTESCCVVCHARRALEPA